jgi:pimeloyl-ACP methyl ester carboxylesterase
MYSETNIKRSRFLETSAAAIGVAAASYSFASAQPEAVATISGVGKPSIVFCHGLWADGSCFTKVMGQLQALGYDCIAAQYPLNTPENDVTFVKWAMDVVKGPIVLVGHSYGGTVITAAGTDPRVKALVYINALAPDTAAGETSQSIQQRFPATDVLKHIKVVDGRIWLTKEGLQYFCGGSLGDRAAARVGDAGRTGCQHLRARCAGRCVEDQTELVHRRKEGSHG